MSSKKRPAGRCQDNLVDTVQPIFFQHLKNRIVLGIHWQQRRAGRLDFTHKDMAC